MGAIGFAFGIERLLMVSGIKYEAASEKLVYLIALGEEAKPKSFQVLADLRKQGVPCDINLNYDVKSMKSAMRKANDLNAGMVLIIGENELKKGVVALKNMLSGEQKEVKVEDLISEFKKGLIC
jgi:histidyl-tRNA synthetase